jgi:hypothetical protein
VLGGAVGVMGVLLGLLAVLDEKRSERSESIPARAREFSSQTPREASRREPEVPRKPAGELAPADVVQVVATSDPQGKEPLSEWPPARAFTARCKAPGGGCVEQCTTLAGGRCLDPCFIHTTDCSNDCKKPDGTCGWPPPDSE